MKIKNNILWRLLYTLAKTIDLIFSILISITGFIVGMARNAFSLIGFILFLGPFALFFLLSPRIFLFILTVAIVGILGNKVVIQLKYIKYMLTEYFYDRADFYRLDRKPRYETFYEYGNRYWQKEAEKKMEEMRRRQEAFRKRQEETERIFRESFFGNWEYYDARSGSNGYSNNNGYSNTGYSGSFKSRYEEACDILGVEYNATKEEIRQAYRRKAKQYHPDINKDENATEMFQKINDANTFLSDDNIIQYNSLN